MVSCPNCGTQDAHFTKPLSVYMTKDEANKQLQMAQNFQQQLSMQQQQFLQQQTPNNLNLQSQACGGAVGGSSGFMGAGIVPSATAVVGGSRVHRVNSA